MWTVTLEDLRFRRRRFVIAIAGTALVFGMALIMSGMAAGFRTEVDNTLATIRADAFVLRPGLAGPFTSMTAIPQETVDQVAAAAGVRRADPFIVYRDVMGRGRDRRDVNILGHRPGGLVAPAVVNGRGVESAGEMVVDRRLGAGVGERLTLQSREFEVVGTTRGLTYLAGVPVAFVTLEDAQALMFDGGSFVTSVLTQGVPEAAPPGLAVVSKSEARADLLRPMEKGVRTLDTTQFLLWLVAVSIIGAIVYLSALERVRDFAVLKAVGASSAVLLGSLAVQAVIVSLIAAAVATGIAAGLQPTFPLPVTIQASAFARLPFVALAVGLLASLAGLKRAVDVDPARAFGSSQ